MPLEVMPLQFVLAGAGLACCVAAFRGFVAARSSAFAVAASSPATMLRPTHYDRSRDRNSLSIRLARSGVSLPPGQWRVRQVTAWLVLAAGFTAVTGSMVAGAGCAATLVRIGTWVSLGVGAARHRVRIDRSATVIAQALVAELRMGRSLADSIITAARSSVREPLASAILAAAARRIIVGVTAGEALNAAATAACGSNGTGLQGSIALVMTACDFGESRPPTAASLDRIAVGVESQRQHRDDLSSRLGESRFVAGAVVGLTLAVAVFTANLTGGAAVLQTMPGLAMCVACCAAGSLGLWMVFRLSAVGP